MGIISNNNHPCIGISGHFLLMFQQPRVVTTAAAGVCWVFSSFSVPNCQDFGVVLMDGMGFYLVSIFVLLRIECLIVDSGYLVTTFLAQDLRTCLVADR